jgi:UDPglucose 6-dehydrogenase
MSPDRVVVGTESEKAKEVMTKLYQPFLINNFRVIFMDIPSAEMTKYAANAMLATKISFMNDIANLCEIMGADVNMVRKGIGSDARIGTKFIYPGVGYGGSCFPKDVKALIHSTDAAGTTLGLVKAAEEANYRQSERFFTKILTRFGSLEGKQFAVWGLAFKPNTDDTREAPAFRLIERLLAAGASVTAYDPEAMENTRYVFGDNIKYANDSSECVMGADALIIATEWNEFRSPDFEVLKKSLQIPIIFDGRNLFNPDDMAKTGFEYYSIGRKEITYS